MEWVKYTKKALFPKRAPFILFLKDKLKKKKSPLGNKIPNLLLLFFSQNKCKILQGGQRVNLSDSLPHSLWHHSLWTGDVSWGRGWAAATLQLSLENGKKMRSKSLSATWSVQSNLWLLFRRRDFIPWTITIVISLDFSCLEVSSLIVITGRTWK